MKRNKQSTSFRLSSVALSILEQLAAQHGNTQTAVLERLLREEARREGIQIATPLRQGECEK